MQWQQLVVLIPFCEFFVLASRHHTIWICCNCGHYGLRQGLQEEAERICVLGLHPRPPSTIRKRCLSVFTWRPGSANCQGDTVQARLHHLQPVGDAQGSTLPEGGSGHRCYLGGAARCSCGAAYMIQGFDRICVFCCCYPPIRPALLLRHKFYVEGWSGV